MVGTICFPQERKRKYLTIKLDRTKTDQTQGSTNTALRTQQDNTSAAKRKSFNYIDICKEIDRILRKE
ncbi:hypothetical protein KIN20_000800 [Parelaphostrongylus tenuis]|uniref:Uncharacterized protein n=1 Tax=Parelaphostrongylus tenuis TaxID=148309 RepID=A0AAD5QBT2_PARTN|nr:hypothetical protein KIN20_000800 [Parelaphostrongylus tenuis]